VASGQQLGRIAVLLEELYGIRDRIGAVVVKCCRYHFLFVVSYLLNRSPSLFSKSKSKIKNQESRIKTQKSRIKTPYSILLPHRLPNPL
jgi:hypothetical protein